MTDSEPLVIGTRMLQAAKSTTTSPTIAWLYVLTNWHKKMNIALFHAFGLYQQMLMSFNGIVALVMA